ncbi:MAG: mechanosensitive ion channel [Lachnospiraceae bacterium]|nr:mechanosensitive ion channel [Lachnospiraceae bacterium]
MRSTKKTCIIAAALSIIGAALLAVLVYGVYMKTAVNRQLDNSRQKLAIIHEQLDELEIEKAGEMEAFDSLYAAKADTLALLFQVDPTYEVTDDHLLEQAALLQVENVSVVNRQGQPLAAARAEEHDLSSSRFDQLRDVFGNGASAEPVTISGDKTLRYFGSRIDNTRMVVLSVDTDRLKDELAVTASVGSVLDGMHVGQNGFAFAVSPLNDTFVYYPEASLQDKNIAAAGLDINQLSDGVNDFMTINGAKYFCSVADMDGYRIVCAVPESEITRTACLTMVIALIVFLVLAGILSLYAVLLRREQNQAAMVAMADAQAENRPQAEGRSPADTPASRAKRTGRFNPTMSKKLMVAGIIALVATFIVAYFVQTLMAISTQSVTNGRRAVEAVHALEESALEAETLNAEYKEDYIEKAEQAAFILKHLDREALTETFMLRLRDALRLDAIQYFDANGHTIASTSNLWNYTLSTDPADQSYAFRAILEGKTLAVVQDPQINETDGVIKQYSGVAVTDDDHRITGLVQVAAVPEKLAEKIRCARLDHVLPGIQTGNNGFVFAVDKETHVVDYAPKDEVIGLQAEDCGMKAHQFMPGFSDYVTLKGSTYFTTCQAYEDELLYVAIPAGSLNKLSLPMALIISFFTLIWLVIFWLCVSYENGAADARRIISEEKADKPENEDDDRMVTVTLEGGKTAKTRSVAGRWSHRDLKWHSKTVEQKLGSVILGVLTVLSVIFLIIMMNADKVFAEDSIIHYILKGTWQKGLNIFAVTDCVIVTVSVLAVSALVRRLIMFLAANLGAKGETLCRILDNFIKFAVFIGLLYYCLNLLGVDVATLVASAGILSLIIGLGANSLVSDILAGLFIVFEGEFQVGDIVTIDGFRGTVIEIGIRTTKVKEGAGNVKIFSNRNVHSVLNMTKDYSVVSCRMSMEYGEDLIYVEKVLSHELQKIAKKLPAIKDGPFYKGVAELGDNSVDILVIAKCAEADRIQLDRDLRREMKLVFDKYGINIPYPQMVINEPATDFHHITKHDEMKVQKFLEEQRELTRTIVEDQK